MVATFLNIEAMYISSSSSKFSRTKVVMVVMMPINKLTQERVTKAEDGMEKMKLAGYMRGTEDHLEKRKNVNQKVLVFYP